MSLNFWKASTVVLLGVLLIGVGFLLSQFFNNSRQQSSVSTSSLPTNSLPNSLASDVSNNRINYEKPTPAETSTPNNNQQTEIKKQPKTLVSNSGQPLTEQPIYASPRNTQPRPRFSIDELKFSAKDKSQSETLKLLGRPYSVSEYGDSKVWNYRNLAYDSVTGNVLTIVSVWFKCGHYLIIPKDSSKDSSKAASEFDSCSVEKVTY